jgi:adenylosuccinate synthase
LHNAIERKKNILFEGAQGTFLDLDHGTYPFVTSSNTTSGGACTGSGVPPNRIDTVIGVMKAYTTRVGEGPFPTEDQKISKMLHHMGREFGSTTGRARRCGWFDAVATRYATMVNGVDRLAITNVDGLDGVEEILICTGYRINGCGKILTIPPADAEELARSQPVYKKMPGWMTSTSLSQNYQDLPSAARNYLQTIAELTGAKLWIVSVGPGREQTMWIE